MGLEMIQRFSWASLSAGLAAASLLAGAANAADLPAPAPMAEPAPVQDRDWISVWAGIAGAPESIYGYLGAVAAINRDLSTNGFLVRFEAGYGWYGYDTGGIDVDVDQFVGDLMLGYQFVYGSGRLSAYLGANFQNHDNDDDPDPDIEGDEWGVKGQLELYQAFSDAFFFYGQGSYSTAFDTYFASGKVAYRFNDWFSIGPEVSALGNEGYDQLRAGASVGLGGSDLGEFIASVGYAWTTSGDGDDGLYGGLHYRNQF